MCSLPECLFPGAGCCALGGEAYLEEVCPWGYTFEDYRMASSSSHSLPPGPLGYEDSFYCQTEFVEALLNFYQFEDQVFNTWTVEGHLFKPLH